MKKIFVFILTVIMALSVFSISIADITNEADVKPYLGMWYGSNIYSYSITIGRNYNTSEYCALVLVYDSSNGNAYYDQYYLTYDREEELMYLTKSAQGVTYKMKIENEQLALYNMITGNWEIKLDKMR